MIPVVALLLHGGCSSREGSGEPVRLEGSLSPEGEQYLARIIADGVEPGPALAIGDDAPGLHNLFFVAPFLFSGSGPDTPEAFDSLASLGIKTVISVDGARPDLELAHERGMRYVHIPIGYNGMTPGERLDLAKAVRDMPAPVYIHCHHGKHRGPTAAAVAMVTLGRLTNSQAAEFMHAAGTSEDYPGLWEAVRDAHASTDAEIDAAYTALCVTFQFPEYQRVSGLTDAMVAIDATWERVTQIRDADWQTPADHPDLAPAAESGILADHFRVLADDPEARAEGAEFLEALRHATERASALEASFTRITPDAAFRERAYQAVASSCNECHKRWRN